MEPSQPMTGNPEIAESLSILDFDAESESFRATYDSTRDSASLAVVDVVATACGRDPLNLTPLQSVIDTDSLDELATETSTGHGTGDSISFCYEEFEITVFSEGVIEADLTENIKVVPMLPYSIACTDCGAPQVGRERTAGAEVIPYQDTCPECGCEDFDVEATTEK